VEEEPHILLEREFASDITELKALPRLLEDARLRCPIGDDQFYNLVIAMTEAVNNAIVHGNKSDPGRRVHYRLECRAEGIHCMVEDEGEGFELDEVDDPLNPDNLLRESGRGMFIISALMSDLHAERTAGGMRIEFLCLRGEPGEEEGG
jgi:serine/threonine-protein kinase RsbW